MSRTKHLIKIQGITKLPSAAVDRKSLRSLNKEQIFTQLHAPLFSILSESEAIENFKKLRDEYKKNGVNAEYSYIGFCGEHRALFYIGKKRKIKICKGCNGLGTFSEGGTFSRSFRCDICCGKQYLEG